mmetsp:Transcript_64772/g.195445  ORF Transcript_64772/g.195445 Transcript_64772/m.195445 type:complete len:348 (-) Transcript_64772:194-1237(-)
MAGGNGASSYTGTNLVFIVQAHHASLVLVVSSMRFTSKKSLARLPRLTRKVYSVSGSRMPVIRNVRLAQRPSLAQACNVTASVENLMAGPSTCAVLAVTSNATPLAGRSTVFDQKLPGQLSPGTSWFATQPTPKDCTLGKKSLFVSIFSTIQASSPMFDKNTALGLKKSKVANGIAPLKNCSSLSSMPARKTNLFRHWVPVSSHGATATGPTEPDAVSLVVFTCKFIHSCLANSKTPSGSTMNSVTEGLNSDIGTSAAPSVGAPNACRDCPSSWIMTVLKLQGLGSLFFTSTNLMSRSSLLTDVVTLPEPFFSSPTPNGPVIVMALSQSPISLQGRTSMLPAHRIRL